MEFASRIDAVEVLNIVGPAFALIAVGYVAARMGLISEGAGKGIAQFSVSIAIPALLFRTIVVANFPESSPLLIWAAYYGAVIATWIIALSLSAALLKTTPAAGVVVATSAVYGNIAMLGIPLVVAALGRDAAGPMALILAINTPLLWLCGSLQMAWIERKVGGASLLVSVLSDLPRNPIILAIAAGYLWRLTGVGLHPLIDKPLELLSVASTPTALVAMGIGLASFRIQGESASLAVMCLLKLIIMPTVAWALAVPLLHLPPASADVVILFAAMPAGANAYLFASQYRLLTNATSAAVGLGTLLSAFILPLVIAFALVPA